MDVTVSPMPPRASRSDSENSARAKDRERRVVEEILWGRPVFRPPELANPRVVFDPLPFRTQSFTPSRPGEGH